MEFTNQLRFEISTKISKRLYDISRSCRLLDLHGSGERNGVYVKENKGELWCKRWSCSG